MSPERITQLRRFAASQRSIDAAAKLLKTGPETLQNAMTGGTFKDETVERIEKRLDELAGERAA
jgi:hypothetical protein